MRGGAWPLLGFGCLMVVMMAFNWIWTDDTIQVASFAFAALALLTAAAVSVLLGRREALRRGPPQPSGEPRAIPAASLGAVGMGIAVGAILLGLVFGEFLTLIGGGLLVASTALVIREVRAQRRARRAWAGRER